MEAGEGVKLRNLRQPPLNTTMMGVLKAVADYHGLGLDEPMIYGLSGHAFMINIHHRLCPSGPYCWKKENATPLIRNMGLMLTDLGFFDGDVEEGPRAEVEKKLRNALDRGIPCSLINLENQIISGYDGTGFFTAQPWPSNRAYPPDRLTFGTWKELGDPFHVSFHTIGAGPRSGRLESIQASLDYGVDVWKNPGKHCSEGYGVGPDAYDNWINALPEHGSSQGNRWNAAVWSECREMAAGFFRALAKDSRGATDPFEQLGRSYLRIAENLNELGCNATAVERKIALLRETRDLELEAIGEVEKLAGALPEGWDSP